MNAYLSPWHIFVRHEGLPPAINEVSIPEIYYT